MINFFLLINLNCFINSGIPEDVLDSDDDALVIDACVVGVDSVGSVVLIFSSVDVEVIVLVLLVSTSVISGIKKR